MKSSLKIEVDYNKCVGSRICNAIAPDVFGLNENGQAQVLDPTADTITNITTAAEACPVAAILVAKTKSKGDQF